MSLTLTRPAPTVEQFGAVLQEFAAAYPAAAERHNVADLRLIVSETGALVLVTEGYADVFESTKHRMNDGELPTIIDADIEIGARGSRITSTLAESIRVGDLLNRFNVRFVAGVVRPQRMGTDGFLEFSTPVVHHMLDSRLAAQFVAQLLPQYGYQIAGHQTLKAA